MREIITTSVFRKQFKKLMKKHYDPAILQKIISILAEEGNLHGKFHDHALSGDMQGLRECHIQPNWLLVYQITEENISLVATGSHDEVLK